MSTTTVESPEVTLTRNAIAEAESRVAAAAAELEAQHYAQALEAATNARGSAGTAMLTSAEVQDPALRGHLRSALKVARGEAHGISARALIGQAHEYRAEKRYNMMRRAADSALNHARNAAELTGDAKRFADVDQLARSLSAIARDALDGGHA